MKEKRRSRGFTLTEMLASIAMLAILAGLLTLQALSVALQADCGQTPADYVRCHPGGKLGQLREGEN